MMLPEVCPEGFRILTPKGVYLGPFETLKEAHAARFGKCFVCQNTLPGHKGWCPLQVSQEGEP